MLDRRLAWQAGFRPAMYLDAERVREVRAAMAEVLRPDGPALVVRTEMGTDVWTAERDWRFCFDPPPPMIWTVGDPPPPLHPPAVLELDDAVARGHRRNLWLGAPVAAPYAVRNPIGAVALGTSAESASRSRRPASAQLTEPRGRPPRSRVRLRASRRSCPLTLLYIRIGWRVPPRHPSAASRNVSYPGTPSRRRLINSPAGPRAVVAV